MPIDGPNGRQGVVVFKHRGEERVVGPFPIRQCWESWRYIRENHPNWNVRVELAPANMTVIKLEV